MNLNISFRNLRPREEIRRRATVLFGKLERFLDASSEASMTVSVEHGQAVLELLVATKGDVHKVVEEHEDLRTALDKLFHTMETHLRRNKERRQERRRGGAAADDGFSGEAAEEWEMMS